MQVTKVIVFVSNITTAHQEVFSLQL